MTISGDRVWEMVRSWEWSPHRGLVLLRKETSQSSLIPSSMWGPSKKMAKNQEVGSHHISNLLASWSWTSAQNYKRSECCLSFSVYDIFVKPPEQTETTVLHIMWSTAVSFTVVSQQMIQRLLTYDEKGK